MCEVLIAMLAEFAGRQLRGGQDNPFEGGYDASAQGEQNINRQAGQGRISCIYSEFRAPIN